MIIESLVTHIVAYFYFMRYPTKLNQSETEKNQTPYTWGIFFSSLIVFGLTDSANYLSWLTISIGLVSGQAVFIKYIQPTLQLYLDSTIKQNETHVLQTFYHKNEDIIAFTLQQTLIFIWIIMLNQLFFYLAHPLTKLFFIIISIGYLSLSNRDSIIWGEVDKRRIFQTLTSYILLSALVLFVSQLLIQLIDSVSNSALQVFPFQNAQASYGLFIRAVLVFLILMRPANLLIRSLSVQYDPKKSLKVEDDAEDDLTEQPSQIQPASREIPVIPNESGFKGAGAMIGNLERILIFLSFLSGSLLSVVAILSIKAFARYKLIADDPYFSEYFVIGTMLSVLITFISYILLVFLLTI
ncbi:MAG: hypothetical protein JJU01_06775 [Alkalibacterium sp.]|nr:hypothetical protein [Alkalibacterium sp.]